MNKMLRLSVAVCALAVSASVAGDKVTVVADARVKTTLMSAQKVADDMREIKLLQEHIHDGLGQLVYDRTGRRPMILPVVVEV